MPRDAVHGGPAPGRRAVLIGDERYRRHSYGADHPLGIPRVSLTLDLIRSYGALTPQEWRQARPATRKELQRFHRPAYLDALRACEAQGKVPGPYRQAHNLGNFENPWFEGMYSTPVLAAGASVQAAEALLAGAVAFNPAGGMHHARADSAHGFCYINDIVLAIHRLREAGMRVLYLDLDAHHGDAVEAAFRNNPDVLTVSFHMDTAYAYPWRGGGLELSSQAVNIPLPAGSGDADFRRLFDRIWPPLLARFAPEAVVVQAGTDILLPDPLGKFRVSTDLFLELLEQVLESAPRHADGTPRLMVVGGGGYHPLALARCWTGVWALLSGRQLPEPLTAEGTRLLRAVAWDLDEEAPYFPRLFRSRLDALPEAAVLPEVELLLGSLTGRGEIW